MKKLWVICLLITSPLLGISPPGSDELKYRTALDACVRNLNANEDENIILDKRSQDAMAARDEAIKLAYEKTPFGIPSEIWFLSGIVLGGATGFFIARNAK